MRSTSDIVFNVTGQTVLHRCQHGRPTVATYKVLEESASDDGTVEFEGTATIENVNTTLAAAAGIGEEDRTLVSLTAGGGTNITTGRRYLLEEGGLKEWILPVSKDGDDLVLSSPLLNAYTSAATVKGTHVSFTVDATWVADENNLKSNPSDPAPAYRVLWLLTVAGVQIVDYTFFDLVRGAVGHGVTLHDVEARFWSLLNDVPIDHRADQGARLLDAAWEDVKSDLAASHLNDAALRDAQLVDQLLIRRIRLMFAENGRRPSDFTPETFLDFARGEYQRFLEKHFLVASKVARAVDSGSGAAKTDTVRYFGK